MKLEGVLQDIYLHELDEAPNKKTESIYKNNR